MKSRALFPVLAAAIATILVGAVPQPALAGGVGNLVAQYTDTNTLQPTFSQASSSGPIQPQFLRADDRVNPIGIGNTRPMLSWTASSSTNGAAQSAYQVRASSSAAKLAAGTSDLWDTGKVTGASQSVEYAGTALSSRSRVFWQVRLWNAADIASDWSATASVELGLLQASDWSARWVTAPEWASGPPAVSPVVVTFTPVSARYVRLDVTKLGLKADGQYYLQLAEMEVRNGAAGPNLARSSTVTSSPALNNWGWGTNFLTDGVTTTNNPSARGFSTGSPSSGQVPDAPIWIQLDLGSVQTVDRVILWPRTDLVTGSEVPSFPVDYSVSTAVDLSTSAYNQIRSISSIPAMTPDAVGGHYTLLVTSTTARFLRIAIPSVGVQVQPGDNQFLSQLAELQVIGQSGDNLALRRPVTTSSSLEGYGWGRQYLVDGVTNTDNPDARGWTSDPGSATAVFSSPQTVTIDLGSNKTFTTITLFPRTDLQNQGMTVSFPTALTVSAAAEPFTVRAALTGQAAPTPPALPLLARDFTVNGPVASARLYVSGIGIYRASLNGAKVGNAELAPGYSDYSRRVDYAVYDVTGQLTQDRNTIGIELGTGIAYQPDYSDRYEKFTTSLSMPKAIAQLELTYQSGQVQVIATDESWKTTINGPTLLSSWYGGESWDGRKVIPNWNAPSGDRSAWKTASLASGPQPALTAAAGPPMQIVDTKPATLVGSPAADVRVYDVGVNIAGVEEVTLTAPRGTVLSIWPGEVLSGGRVSQGMGTTGTPIYDTVVSPGGTFTWRPSFRYSGFQYLEIRGVTADTVVSSVKAQVIRTANDAAGIFASSDPTINAIHSMVDRAIQSNMYSVLTDCPSREKLGWMEQNHLVFAPIMRGYDVAAYARSIVRQIAEAQLPDGSVPDIAPELVVFSPQFRFDPNWGGALVLMPWAMYENYGDQQTLATYYPQMKSLLAYYESKRLAGTETMNYPGDYSQGGLGDWGAAETGTDRNLVHTFGYYRVVDAMAKIATVLGNNADAAAYAAKASRIQSDTAQRWYNSSTNQVDAGTQADYALALDMGAIPSADRAAVVAKLVASIAQRGNRLATGEIAMPSVYRVLAAAGQDQLIYTMTTQSTQPSFGYFVAQGATSLPEYWPISNGSRNHFMLGSIDEWFTSRVAGITQEAGSVSYQKIVFKPTIVGGMTHAESSYRTKNGQVAISWTVGDANAIALDATVPVGSTATVQVPLLGPSGSQVPQSQDGATFVGLTTIDGSRYATFTVGSGTWRFTTAPATLVPVAQLSGSTLGGATLGPVAVIARSASGVPLNGVDVTFTVTGPATLYPGGSPSTTVRTNSAGIATVSVGTAPLRAGVVTMTASLPGGSSIPVGSAFLYGIG